MSAPGRVIPSRAGAHVSTSAFRGALHRRVYDITGIYAPVIARCVRGRCGARGATPGAGLINNEASSSRRVLEHLLIYIFGEVSTGHFSGFIDDLLRDAAAETAKGVAGAVRGQRQWTRPAEYS
ncbi:hypothetical protein EVAR_53859_1 [Eumeta japonica]|uniref:Uncharacterized protein n=1 Tax=Eumeta variegata TaxID=151549 RepID=A0A4C1XDU1_EUMVA|nr:hypothetical protein EVAR_53859_1 [Eumeta japonica]